MKIPFKKIILVLFVCCSGELLALSLKDAIDTTLSANQNIKIKKENINYLKGRKLSNEELFDPIVTTSISVKNQTSENSIFVEPKTQTTTKTNNLGLGVQKYFTNGVTLSSGFSYNYNDIEQVPINSDENIYLNISYPLLKNNRKSIVGGNIELSNMDIEIGQLNYRENISSTILETISAYLNYVNLYEIHKLNKLSLQRADKLYEEIEILTNADEKPKSDLKQPLASVVNKNLSVVTSQNELQNGRNTLCLAMDISLERCLKLTQPSDNLFQIDIDSSKILSSDDIYHKQLDDNRIDLKVLDIELEKLQLSLDIAKDDLKDDLDLKFNISSNSQNLNKDISLPTFSSNHREGNIVELSLSYKFNINNNGKKGAYISSLSHYKQNKFLVEKTKKEAHLKLEEHIRKIKTTISQYKQTGKSLKIYKEILQNEKDKYKLGLATTLDIIQTQESLSSVKLNMINYLYKFSIELTQLKYYTQTLLTKNGNEFVVNYKER
ncbi:MAG: TolC family protein [Campylobacterota bacterium]|nr:TolC family protein [Campylobacterota bacterium]